jgi:O-antigen ligase
MLLGWWAFARVDLYLTVVLAWVPLSVNLSEFGLVSMGWYMPTEPMLFALLLVAVARWLSGQTPHPSLLHHPATWVVGAGFLWMGLTILPSSHPLVSLKAWVARAWFLASFYVLMAEWFRSSEHARTRFLALLLVPLVGVITYTLIRHSGYGFSKAAGHWVMKPFFKDHTSYGAVLAMMIPPVLAMVWRTHQSTFARVLWGLGLAWLLLGTVLSFTRAAWVSLAAVGALWVVMRLGVRLRTLVAAGSAVAIGLALSFDVLVVELERNKQDSSDNLTQDRPFWGWGPGTYQFEYAPFQTSSLRTNISTNNADLGNAHSEYLGPLAEQGVLGLLGFLALLGVTLHLGFKLQRTLQSREQRWVAMGLFLGLMTYFVHGVLNNYLDTDKASAPFWGFLAWLVVLDLGAGSRKADGQQGGVVEA